MSDAAQARALFDVLDRDNSGSLDINEFIKFVKAVYAGGDVDAMKEAAQSILDFTDTNKDGKADLEEWTNMVVQWQHPEKSKLMSLFIKEAPKSKYNSKLSDL